MVTAMQICNHPFYIAILEHIAYLITFKLKALHQAKLGLLFPWLPPFFQCHKRSYQNTVQYGIESMNKFVFSCNLFSFFQIRIYSNFTLLTFFFGDVFDLALAAG